MKQKIIDMRNRPAFLHDFFGATPNTPSYATAKWLNQRVGSLEPEHFRRSYTVEGYLQEIDEAGIDYAVVVGRETPDLTIDDHQVAQLVSHSPKLVGLGSVDIETRGVESALAAIDQAIHQHQFKAINIEPGFGKPARYVDDPIFDPVYQACQRHKVPVCVMSGPTTPDLDYAHPNAVARLARKYPDLNIICFHGYYPFVNEIVGAAFRYPNLYLVPDMYIFQPGAELYVQAANKFLGDQLLFGTSYPFRPMQQTIDDFIQLGFKDEVLEKVFYSNAAGLLNLGEKE
ncbi:MULTISPECIES: amidohydrolase family protein [unclassified Methylophilus]|uniref:amidohydrolase family protein n=1 Tax=unclassified Methylophilus TaxID=2630143 RepID=UPI0006F3A06F|nr:MULTISPECIES: amidohydrolase family protein [unclassified Methylophilus]KQT43883.1 amidohydrolase [Methylophilus sp. Leaf416]KQT59367.1 amidohydrolase [Methylophilus sp. Leaf459]